MAIDKINDLIMHNSGAMRGWPVAKYILIFLLHRSETQQAEISAALGCIDEWSL